MLWTVDGSEDETHLNSLQAAIAEKNSESRLQAFLSCIAVMEHNLDVPEWKTLLEIFQHVRNLPLSTLNVWSALLHSPRIMAMHSAASGISFENVTSRICTELPFLWNFVSLQDWSAASQCIRYSFEGLFPGDTAFGFGRVLCRRLWKILVHAVRLSIRLCMLPFPLPEDVPILTRACPHFPCTSRVPSVRGATIPKCRNCFGDTLMTNGRWRLRPSATGNGAVTASNRSCRPEGARDSVLGLPILLMFQAF